MFMFNSSQMNRSTRAQQKKIVKDILVIGLIAVGLKVAATILNGNRK